MSTDSVNITAGVGTPIAVDDIDGVDFQRVKLTVGGDGVDDGDVASTNPLPAGITDGDGPAYPATVHGEEGRAKVFATDPALLVAIAGMQDTLQAIHHLLLELLHG